MLKLNLTQRFLIYLVLLSFLPILIVGGVAYNIAANTLLSESSSYAETLLKTESQQIRLTLQQFENALNGIAGVQEIRDTLASAKTDATTFERISTQARVGYIVNPYITIPGLLSIDIFTASGVQYHVGETLNFTNVRRDVLARLEAEALAADRSVIWSGVEPNINADSRYQQVITAASILTETDAQTLQPKPIATMILSYDPAALAQSILYSDLLPGRILLVMDRDARFVIHPDPAAIGTTADPGLVALANAPNSKDEIPFRGSQYIAHTQLEPYTGWQMIFLTPTSVVNASSQSILQATLGAMLVSFIVIILSALSIQHFVVTPIRQMTGRFQSLQEQDAESLPRLPVRGDGEISDLNRWFNRFLDNLVVTQRTEKALAERVAFEGLIVNISASFINVNPNDLDTTIEDALGRIGALSQVDRAYMVVLPDSSAGTAVRTHAWEASESSPSQRALHLLSMETLPQLMTGLRNFRRVYMPDVKALPAQWIREREAFEPQGIQSLIVVPIVWSGKLIGFLGFEAMRAKRVWDEETIGLLELVGQIFITALKRAQTEREREQLILDLRAATHKAEESARMKSEFLATMSHELRTPLNAIEGFTSIMLEGMGVEIDGRGRGMLERISANSRRLLGLINDLLDLSRIEAGRLDLSMKPISPVQMVDHWSGQIHSLVANKGLTFETFIAPDLPQTVISDEEALSKIVINLLSNAIKFTAAGKVRLAWETDSQEWSIAVTDTGIGIPPHARDYIFDEFRQVDQSSRRQYGGTGLGLAIVRRLVTAMKGHITLDSEPGKGSTFRVIFPHPDKTPKIAPSTSAVSMPVETLGTHE